MDRTDVNAILARLKGGEAAAKALDRVRFLTSDKRTGNHVALDEVKHPLGVSGSNLLALDEALKRLEALDPELVQVVEMRFFAGYGIADTARILDVSPRTVVRRWEIARAWLARELADG